MTDRDRIAHLLRRLGFGAGRAEVDRLVPLGVDGAIRNLVDFEGVPEQFPIRPFDFAAYDGGLMTEPPRFASWWALRMVMTQRPLQEKLTLFWHSHFAVSAAKVFEGVSMLRYMEKLRAGASGPFPDLLKSISMDTAMLYYLDTQTSLKDHPNENFARELFELFTMGKGYTEKDIQEAARAFTGWSIQFSGLGNDAAFDKQVQEAAKRGRSVFSFCIVPDEFDTGSKTIFGQTKNFRGEDVLELAASRPETAIHLSRKMCRWFVGDASNPALEEKVAQTFTREKTAKAMLKTIVASDEFWKPGSVVSSPADFVVGFLRSLAVQPILLQLAGTPSGEWKPVRKELEGLAGGAFFLMTQQGLSLLYPPNVSGWPWGKEWVTANNMAQRISMASTLLLGEDKNRPIAGILGGRIMQDYKPTTADALADGFLELLDGSRLPPGTRAAVAEAAAKGGGPAVLADKEKGAQMLAQMTKLLFAAPEYHVC